MCYKCTTGCNSNSIINSRTKREIIYNLFVGLHHDVLQRENLSHSHPVVGRKWLPRAMYNIAFYFCPSFVVPLTFWRYGARFHLCFVCLEQWTTNHSYSSSAAILRWFHCTTDSSCFMLGIPFLFRRYYNRKNVSIPLYRKMIRFTFRRNFRKRVIPRLRLFIFTFTVTEFDRRVNNRRSIERNMKNTYEHNMRNDVQFSVGK